MDYCHNELDYREGEGILIALTLLLLYVFLYLVELLLKGLYSLNILASCLLLVPLLLCCLLAAGTATCYLIDSRKYMLTDEGIVLQYFGKIKKLYSWDSVKEVGICKVNYTTRGPEEYLTVLRVVTIDEKKGPQHGPGFWANGLYTQYHWRSIITISYNEYRHQSFMSFCPEKVVDYRHLKRY